MNFEEHAAKPLLAAAGITIPEDRPSEEELFGPYWAKYGK